MQLLLRREFVNISPYLKKEKEKPGLDYRQIPAVEISRESRVEATYSFRSQFCATPPLRLSAYKRLIGGNKRESHQTLCLFPPILV